jgi:hypothetical protein
MSRRSGIMVRRLAKTRRHKFTPTPARAHSDYADDGYMPPARPHENGDYHDPVKYFTGRGNASKGPYRQQGGAGHGDNYGARKEPVTSDRHDD